VALGRLGMDLVRAIDCARLSLHGGSFCEALASGLVTSRITRPVRSRRSSNFNSYWDIPCGAVKGAIDDVVLGNLTGLLARIKPEHSHL
jgi:hypothetical protein